MVGQSFADESENLPLESIQRIDRHRDRYEGQWNEQRHTQLEEYLKQVPDHDRAALFKALLKVELELQSSEALDQLAPELLKRFPDYQSKITQLIESASKQLPPNSGLDSSSGSRPEASSMGEVEHPEKIERFEVLDVLGEGGFGTVYKAFDPDLNRTIALKIPLPSTLKSKENLDRFVREAQFAASLYYPGICPIFDVEQLDPWGTRFYSSRQQYTITCSEGCKFSLLKTLLRNPAQLQVQTFR